MTIRPVATIICHLALFPFCRLLFYFQIPARYKLLVTSADPDGSVPNPTVLLVPHSIQFFYYLIIHSPLDWRHLLAFSLLHADSNLTGS